MSRHHDLGGELTSPDLATQLWDATRSAHAALVDVPQAMQAHWDHIGHTLADWPPLIIAGQEDRPGRRSVDITWKLMDSDVLVCESSRPRLWDELYAHASADLSKAPDDEIVRAIDELAKSQTYGRLARPKPLLGIEAEWDHAKKRRLFSPDYVYDALTPCLMPLISSIVFRDAPNTEIALGARTIHNGKRATAALQDLTHLSGFEGSHRRKNLMGQERSYSNDATLEQLKRYLQNEYLSPHLGNLAALEAMDAMLTERLWVGEPSENRTVITSW